MNTVREQYTWEEFEHDCVKIAAWAKTKHVKNVYGIPRGGLVIAVKLSHLLDLPVVLNRDDISPDTLIVDDIVDGGGTIERLLALTGRHSHIASIFYNKSATHAPHFFVREKSGWVVFPWETERSSKYDGTLG
jgi:hypoxanthine phosphoribosyltransferase